eukprot:TRINITY_DN10115_c1_g3_i3.p1 TRINITY_DN10115_c1_g3~~TRINITY_DN10115_c1_g3_i3.p1  ORF type:complete len:1055 (-),score=222.61 TRINITY_DN10115_c1_g3_i3:276-2990(-)
MTMDTSVARRVAGPVLYLAGPGVLINAVVTAVCLWWYLPYDWSFLLCLTVGSILSATDPVAVVALLKELGASPVLTVQIQGESLLNDGSSIVLFTVGYEMLRGLQFSAWDVFIFLTETAACAWVVGMCIGWFFVACIKASANKFEHSSRLIQVVGTICCAYWSFLIADGLLHISGALSCVSASLVLAHKMWPKIVDRESMHNFWHVFEYLGNSLIFLLAGALTGKSMVHIQREDYFHLVVIYLVLVVIRGGMIFFSRPILEYLTEEGQPVTEADAMVMTWGGLRGAVGLALAIQVATDRAGGSIDAADAHRVLFYVGGIAALTLIINATTSPFLVEWLGITQMPEAKKELLLLFHDRMNYKANERQHKLGREVGAIVDHALSDVRQNVSREGLAHDSSEAETEDSHTPPRGMRRMKTLQAILPSRKNRRTKSLWLTSQRDGKEAAGEELVKGLKDAKAAVTAIGFLNRANRHFSAILDGFPKMPCESQMEGVCSLVCTMPVRWELLRTVNETFLQLVRSHYWQQTQRGALSSSRDHQLLMLSTSMAMSDTYSLRDYEYLCTLLREEDMQDTLISTEAKNYADANCLRRFTESPAFTIFMMLVIVASAVASQVGQQLEIWLSLEIMFNIIFSLEFVLKALAQGPSYFNDRWNLFDVMMVAVGLIGLFFHNSVGTKGDLLRVVRLFRTLRFMRIFRLVRFIKHLRARLSKKSVSWGIATHMRRLYVLTSFVTARVEAQEQLVSCFCTAGAEVETVELAWCIIQAQTSALQAIAEAVRAEQALVTQANETFREVCVLRESLEVIADLETFVGKAHSSGVLDSREAETLLHPLYDHHKEMLGRLTMAHAGFANGDETVRAIVSRRNKRLKPLIQRVMARVRNSDESGASVSEASPADDADENTQLLSS